MNSIRIVAEMQIKPEDLDSARKLLKDMAAASQAEAGNIAYVITEDTSKPGHIMILEEWQSPEAISEHNETRHFRDFQKAIAPSVQKSTVTTLKRLY